MKGETAGRKVGPDRLGRAGDVTGVVCILGWPQLAGRKEAAGGAIGKMRTAVRPEGP